MEDKRLDVLKSMKDHYDHLYSRVHYLLVAHGAGFVGGLTILKEYTSTPQYRGVGLPIALFGVGLIAAIVAYITLSLAQMHAKNSVFDKKEYAPLQWAFCQWGIGLALSKIAAKSRNIEDAITAVDILAEANSVISQSDDERAKPGIVGALEEATALAKDLQATARK